MDSPHSKETHFSFPEFQYSNPEDKAQTSDQSARIPVISAYFPLRYRTLTQLGCIVGLAAVSLRALLVVCQVLCVDANPWIDRLRRMVVFDKIIIGVFTAAWYMRILIEIWEADLLLSKMEAAAGGDARAQTDMVALREKRDWGMLLNHRPFNLSWVFGARG
ncbi:hypothetical protein N0V84_010502 [Fusarium piperis]|uniref:Uncharacterized protein n=1 Tax=Fusarium piperis TaxID=1435070 RepID=A0A9W8W4J4_9HYPO|nr:hypothetical protein N0V84_010502 [Fusarium piperis]